MMISPTVPQSLWDVPEKDFTLKENACARDGQAIGEMYSVIGYGRNLHRWRISLVCQDIGKRAAGAFQAIACAP